MTSRIVAVLTAIAFATSVHAIEMCGQFENYVCDANYSFETCVWGATGWWEQCVITPCDANNSWDLTYGFPGGWNDWQVQSYPNVCFQDGMNGRTLPSGWPYQVRDLKPTYIDWTIDQMPTEGRWNCDFEMWIARQPYDGDRDRQLEIMVCLNYTDDLGPGANDPRVNIDGRTYAYKDMSWASWDFVSYSAINRVTSVQRINTTSFVEHCMNLGYANPDHYMSCIQAGFEIFWGYGTASVSNYRVYQEDTDVISRKANSRFVGQRNGTRLQAVTDGALTIAPTQQELGYPRIYNLQGKPVPTRMHRNPGNGVYVLPVSATR